MQGRRFRFGDYEADFGLRELRKRGTRIGLQHKPFHVLELLLSNAGQLVTRQELFDRLWPDSHVSFERGLNSAVNSLRHVLGESSRECHYIETRPGLGYRFIAPIQEIAVMPLTEAYQDCLKGRYLLDRFWEEDIHKALAYFHSAAVDETYAPLANAGIADAYCRLAAVGSVAGARVSALARASADTAVQGNPELAQAHVASARVKMLFDWDWSGAREAVLRALKLDGRSAEAHTLLASLLGTLGDHAAALDHCRQALEIDPLSFPAGLQMAACHQAARDFQAAVNQCWKMLSLAPDFAPAQLMMGLAYQQLGMPDEAAIEFQNARLSPACSVAALSGLSSLFAAMGLSDYAERTYSELSELGRSRHVSGYWYAVVCAGRKDYDDALCHLEHASRQRDASFLLLKSDARFDALGEAPRFQELLGYLS